eukprot:CAMPEP_0194444154 /NCGR_PEP_ID=MMETSP0176-20130528/127106_1 /TAXON_ID=216777 /ORGANISM="Proboscia alata, Strain PI-D3" /LENGTH=1107 /DNA_ID=CAMNT_0039270487 /DNA_START=26 /DNA_END=3349 /DNA_ORIENTATION=+
MRIVTKNVIYFEALAAVYIISTSISGVSSHGYMSSPRSLNYKAHVDGLEWGTEAGKPAKENCEHCLNVKDLTGVCGKTGTHNYDDFRDSLGDLMPWFTEAVYVEGQIITVRSELPVHHWGHAELRGCPNGMEPSLECFDQYPLEYVDDVMWGGIIPKHEGYPMYAHFAGSDKIVYDHRFKLPMGLAGQHVLLQWKYITSNSCNPPGYLDYPWPENETWWSGKYLGNCDPPPYPEDGNRPAGAPEQFWGCAQVTITPSGPTSSPVPTPAPVPQTPKPTKAPNSKNPSNQPQEPVAPTPTPPGSQIATTTRYWDCSGGSCGCAYLPSHLGGDNEKPAHCYSNALFAAPEGNSFGAKYYGAAAVSNELGGADWMGDACGKCWKVTGTSNIPGYQGIETTLVLKGTNYCPTNAQHCELGKAHFDIAAPGFDWVGASLSNSCKEREPDQVGGFEACGTWMINSQNPNQNCYCNFFTDPVLRAGCENFRSLYWDNPSVYYEEVTCPDEMATPCWEENGDSYPEFGEIPDTCMSPTGELPPTNPPVPTTPVTPGTQSPVDVVDFCNWGHNGDAASSTCEDGMMGDEWCNENQPNCEDCGGRWCIATNAPVVSPSTPQQPVAPTPTPPGSQIATTTRYWDCSGGSCGCAYLPSHLGGDNEKPAHCYSNALFAAPEGNSFGAKYYGAAAVSNELGGADWMGDACGKCWKVTGTSNIPGYQGIETTLVLKGTNYCPTNAQHCELGKAHFDIAAPGFDWVGASLSNSCKEREPDQVGGFEACGTWMINSQNPNQNCDCESFTDPVLRAGCENFRSLYWDNPSVYYEEVTCPDEMATPCWEENGDSYPEFGEIPDTCMSPTGDKPTGPTDAPISSPTGTPVANPTSAPVPSPTDKPVKAPTKPLKCKSSCYEIEMPWKKICKKKNCNGCPKCIPSPTSPPLFHCWEENGDSYPEFGEIPDTCMSPTGEMPTGPTDAPISSPTDKPVKAPTKPLKCISSCYEIEKPWNKICKKEKCKGCPKCIPSPTSPPLFHPTQPPVDGNDYCCTWNFHNCGEIPFCNENSKNCQSRCGGSWLSKSAPAMQCIAMFLECTADENACCEDLICSGAGSYKQCVDPAAVV